MFPTIYCKNINSVITIKSHIQGNFNYLAVQTKIILMVDRN